MKDMKNIPSYWGTAMKRTKKAKFAALVAVFLSVAFTFVQYSWTSYTQTAIAAALEFVALIMIIKGVCHLVADYREWVKMATQIDFCLK